VQSESELVAGMGVKVLRAGCYLLNSKGVLKKLEPLEELFVLARPFRYSMMERLLAEYKKLGKYSDLELVRDEIKRFEYASLQLAAVRHLKSFIPIEFYRMVLCDVLDPYKTENGYIYFGKSENEAGSFSEIETRLYFLEHYQRIEGLSFLLDSEEIIEIDSKIQFEFKKTESIIYTKVDYMLFITSFQKLQDSYILSTSISDHQKLETSKLLYSRIKTKKTFDEIFEEINLSQASQIVRKV
jgi:hypothetical protein